MRRCWLWVRCAGYIPASNSDDEGNGISGASFLVSWKVLASVLTPAEKFLAWR